MMNYFNNTVQSIAKQFMGVLKDSQFYTEGVLTPEEFIEAGDFLTQKFPTWKWCSAGKDTKPVDYLPEDKQYLVTIGVPCGRRARDYEKEQSSAEVITSDDWVETNVEFIKTNKEAIDVDESEPIKNTQTIDNKPLNIDDDDGIEVVTDGIENKINLDTNDFIVVDEDDDDNIVRTRKYDVTVIYDFYYRVPRMLLTGYNENNIPLTDEEIKQDIMLDYMDKTVTIEVHPFTHVKSVSIHPCKHSLLLKKLIANYEKEGRVLYPYMSILLFLKFLHSIVPTIQYDFTMDLVF